MLFLFFVFLCVAIEMTFTFSLFLGIKCWKNFGKERSSWKATLLARNKDIIKYRDGYMKIKEEKLINENL